MPTRFTAAALMTMILPEAQSCVLDGIIAEGLTLLVSHPSWGRVGGRWPSPSPSLAGRWRWATSRLRRATFSIWPWKTTDGD